MQDGPMRPAAKMNEADQMMGKFFRNLLTMIMTFGLLVGADCTAIWLMGK